MKPIRFTILAVMALILTACGTTKVVETWESDTAVAEAPNRMAVLVVWPEHIQRLAVERDMVAHLRDKGVNAVASSEIPGMRDKLTPESVEIALRNVNVDGLLLVYLIGGGGGGTYERADYWAQYAGSGFSGYGWYNPYYAGYYDVYVIREGPGYAEKTTQVFMETSYIDVRRLERVWSMVTRSKDVEYQDVAARLGDRVVSQMKSSGQM